MKKIALLSILIFLLKLNSISQSEIFFEDFQNIGLEIPSSFTIVDNDGLNPHSSVNEYDSAWIAIPDPFDNGNSNQLASSTSYFDPIGEADRWLITPGISLGQYGNILSWEAQSHDPSFPDGYYVLVSETDTELTSFSDTLAYVYAEIADSLNYNEVNISEFDYNNQTIYIAFVNRTNNGFKLYLDNIRLVKEDPIGLDELNKTPKKLIKIVDVLGRETPFKPNTTLLYIFNNGTVERKMIVE